MFKALECLTPGRITAGLLALLCLMLGNALCAATPALGPIVRVAGSDVGAGGDVGQYSAMDVDGFGGVHIAYFDVTNRQLKYARKPRPNLPWRIEVVDSTEDSGRYASLAVGPLYARPATVNYTNGSDIVNLFPGVFLRNDRLVGARLRRNTEVTTYIITDVVTTDTVRLDRPYVGPTNIAISSTVDYYSPVISYQRVLSNFASSLQLAVPSFGLDFQLDRVDPPRGQTLLANQRRGFHTDIAISTTRTMHLVWQNRDTDQTPVGSMHYASALTSYSLPTTYAEEFIENTPGMGENARVALDAAGIPVVVYRDQLNEDVYINRKNPVTGLWGRLLLDSDALEPGRGLDVQYSPWLDRFLTSYSDPSATPTLNVLLGKTMLTTTGFFPPDNPDRIAFGVGTGAYTTLAAGDGANELYHVFYDAGPGTLRYVQSNNPTTTWSRTRGLDGRTDVGRYVSAGVNPATNALNAAYYDATVGALKFATFDGAATTTTEYVDGIKFGSMSSIGNTTSETVVAYFSDTDGALRVARWPRGTQPGGPGFSDVIVDQYSLRVGEFPSLVVDSADRIHVTYLDRINYELRYAVYNQGTWYKKPIIGAATGRSGEYAHLTINSFGDQMAVAYYDKDSRQLEYAYGSVPAVGAGDPNTTFTQVNPLTGVDTGRFCSLTYSGGANLFAAYYNDATQGLEVASIPVGGVATVEQVESGVFNQTGYYTSIQVDPLTNQPLVAYYNVTNGTLRFAEKIAGGWRVTTLDNSGDTGRSPVLLVDRTRNAIIVIYHALSAGELRVVTRPLSGGSWSTPVTLADQGRGATPSAVLDAATGELTLSFYDEYLGDLLTSGTGEAIALTGAQPGWESYE